MDHLPIVFVIPPPASLECSIHKGILNNPVDTSCGCTYCGSCISEYITKHSVCPVHATPLTSEHLRRNERAEGFINELLIRCRGGLQQTADGTWEANPEGCKLWITLGKRAEHENSCIHVRNLRKDNKWEPRSHTAHACIYKDAGCSFTGYTVQELCLHTERCEFGYLMKRVSQLEREVMEKDLEIARLSCLNAEVPSSGPNVKHILDSISRGLDKLDEDSTRLFEDAKDTLRKTRTNIVSSSAYQTSLQVLHSIKEVVESARAEFVSKVVELEMLAKTKVRLLNIHPENTPKNSNNDLPSPSQDSNVLPSVPQYSPSDETAPEVLDTSNVDNQRQDNEKPVEQPNPEPAAVTEEGDEDLQEFLLISKQEYQIEEQARQAEEEAVRQAVQLSLLDFKA